MIAAFLPVAALKSLRLTCREIESKTLWHFADKYFKKVEFMHSKYALEALLAMSASRMGQYVQTVCFGPVSNDQGPIKFNAIKVSSNKKNKISADMNQYAEDNRRMRVLGEDADMIRRAFQNLRHVTKLIYTDRCSCCPPPSFGGRYLEESVGAGVASFEEIAIDATQSMARLFTITIQAAETAGLRLESIDCSISPIMGFNHRFEEEGTGFAAIAIDFPVAAPMNNPRTWAFEELTILKIFLGHLQEAVNEPLRKRFVNRLLAFMSRAPQLHTLGVSTSLQGAAGFSLVEIASSDALKKIENFEIIGLAACMHTMTAIFEPLCDTLRGLKLYNILMPPMLWIEFLEWTRDNMKKLKEIDIDYPFPHDSGFEFPPPTQYKGEHMDSFLVAIIDEWAELHEMIDEFEDSDMESDMSY